VKQSSLFEKLIVYQRALGFAEKIADLTDHLSNGSLQRGRLSCQAISKHQGIPGGYSLRRQSDRPLARAS